MIIEQEFPFSDSASSHRWTRRQKKTFATWCVSPIPPLQVHSTFLPCPCCFCDHTKSLFYDNLAAFHSLRKACIGEDRPLLTYPSNCTTTQYMGYSEAGEMSLGLWWWKFPRQGPNQIANKRCSHRKAVYTCSLDFLKVSVLELGGM